MMKEWTFNGGANDEVLFKISIELSKGIRLE